MRASKGTIYKSAGAQLATVSHGLQQIVKVWNVDHLFTISLYVPLLLLLLLLLNCVFVSVWLLTRYEQLVWCKSVQCLETVWYVCLTRSPLVTLQILRIICARVGCSLLSIFLFFSSCFSFCALCTIYTTRNSSGDEIANVNFLYDDIVHAVKIQ